jgi:hypothetical protein
MAFVPEMVQIVRDGFEVLEAVCQIGTKAFSAQQLQQALEYAH